jgi:hypothetical protein
MRDHVLERPLVRCVGNAVDGIVVHALEQGEHALGLRRERRERVIAGHVSDVRRGIVGKLAGQRSSALDVCG